MFENFHTTSRRTFLRQAACAALGATAMVNTLSSLQLTSAALAQSSTLGNSGGNSSGNSGGNSSAAGAEDEDYKALVCIFLAGGNDSNNLLIPAGSARTNPLREDYLQARGTLAINNLSNELEIPQSTAAFSKHFGDALPPMAVHPDAPEIAELFNNDELAFICNVGTLAEPIESRADYLSGSIALPGDLFSHSDQVMQWQTSISDGSATTGWGGRVADLLHSAHNLENSQVSMAVSIAGINVFQRSALDETVPFSVGRSGVKTLAGFGSATQPYRDAYSSGGSYLDPRYKGNRVGTRLETLERLLQLSRSNLIAQNHTNTVVRARVLEETIGQALQVADLTGVNFDRQFIGAQTKLGDQLKMVAKLIAARSVLGNRRQIFFVSVGGYDIHKEHLASHAGLMEELSTGLMAFRDTLKAQGDWDKVVAFTGSDFNRTLTTNGSDESAGTDHAWGGHSMVMGGPVKGGDLYGHFPSLKLGDHAESIDAHEGRGRWIPSVSVDQYSAALAQWMGVESSAMEEIFPNLYRFDNPLTSSTPNLKFLG